MRDINDILKARSAILEDLKTRYNQGDEHVQANEPWSASDQNHNCFSGAGRIKCPVCEKGLLRYARSSLNGHIHASCATKDCVAWME